MKKQPIVANYRKEELQNYVMDTLDKVDFSVTPNLTISLNAFIERIMEDTPDIHIYATPLVMLKMQSLVQASTKEIAWHGILIEHDGSYYITDVITYPQIASGMTVDADEAAYGSWLLSNKENINLIRMQGHSHVNMGVTPSPTDISYYKDLTAQVDDHYLFIVLNKSNAIHTRFYDIKNNILYTDVPIELYVDKKEFSLSEWTSKQLENVKERVYKTTVAAPSEAKKFDDKLGEIAYDTVYGRNGDYR